MKILVDPGKARQIFTNLIDNAIKFSPDSGVVELAATEVKEGDAEEGDPRGAVVLSVKDTGVGIAPEHHAMIFESFQQVDGSHTRKAGGTGLGLAITKKLVERHAGAIWLESELGAGSTFFVRLPAPASSSSPLLAALGATMEDPTPAEGRKGSP